MSTLGILVIAAYIISLGVISLYCITQVMLLFSYRKSLKQFKLHSNEVQLTNYPRVTVQLPLYNEMYVVERLVDSVILLNYPKDKLQIQVLDDSTDETLELTRAKVAEYQAQGFDIELIRRPDRSGFKAGALQYGLQYATGEFVAIFDADFIPNPDFLLQTLANFEDPKVGLVQTKWEHLNKEYSILTRVQAFALDAHFNIEQSGRYAAGLFMHFNGTAGVWRKACIESAGGWSADTLTEDLDLSYRAQMAGWKFVFLAGVGSPAELPVAMSAIKSQQFRWNKGPAEVTRKLLLKVLLSDLPFKIKWHSFFHLLNSSMNIFILATAILSVPLLYYKMLYGEYLVFDLIYVFMLGLLAIGGFYLASQIRETQSVRKGIRSFVVLFPSFLSLSMGLSFHNAIAAVRGLLGERTAFIRTPKLKIESSAGNWKAKKYNDLKVSWISLWELALAAYFLYGIYIAFLYQEFGLLPFHLMLFLGYLSISYFSIKHALTPTRGKEQIA